MATVFNPGGNQSPTSRSRTIEKVFEDAQVTSRINLSNRKLKDFPSLSKKYNLEDTTVADLSKNRFTDIPCECCLYHSLEQLNCYHNVIRTIPEAIVNLQTLVQLNLSRNQLSNIPPDICKLRTLEILHASNNKLVSLPEEIGQLERLMDVDVSCNEITHLPSQIGDLKCLRSLNVRRNLLVEIPEEVCRLKLRKLDIGANRITKLPTSIKDITTLEDIIVDNNPLEFPPASVCTKGRKHIKKFLENEASKEERRRGILGEVNLRQRSRSTALMQSPMNSEFRYTDSLERRKRLTVDSGYSTTDSSEKSYWSPSEFEMDSSTLLGTVNRSILRLHNNNIVLNAGHRAGPEDAKTYALQAGEKVKEHRQEREQELQRRLSGQPPIITTTAPSPQISRHHNRTQPSPNGPQPSNNQTQLSPSGPQPSNNRTQPSPSVNRHNLTVNTHLSPITSVGQMSNTPPTITPGSAETDPFDGYSVEGSGTLVDEFTRELHRQKQAYEAKKRNAEKLKQSIKSDDTDPVENDDSESSEKGSTENMREETRRAAMKLKESQKQAMEKQREEAKRRADSSTPVKSATMPKSVSSSSSLSSGGSYNEDGTQNRRPGQSKSNSFRGDETRQPYANTHVYRRTVSDTPITSQYGHPPQSPSPNRDQYRNSDSPRSPSSYESSPHNASVTHNPMEDEFRIRREAIYLQQRQEAQSLQHKMEEEKSRVKQMQTSIPHYQGKPERRDYSYNGGAVVNHRGNGREGGQPYQNTLDKLESMSADLNNHNPNFTVRRRLLQSQEEERKTEELRKLIESRLKITLPENLSSALSDGVVLCHLANHIRPRSISTIHVPSPAVQKLPQIKCQKNVENFLTACRRIGVSEDRLCNAMTILSEKSVGYVSRTVHALLECASAPQQSMV